jgi:hypothetical protein
VSLSAHPSSTTAKSVTAATVPPGKLDERDLLFLDVAHVLDTVLGQVKADAHRWESRPAPVERHPSDLAVLTGRS